MSVIFEIYLFTPEYSKQIKKRETKARKTMEKEFIAEQGAVICMNTYREPGLPFFNPEELLNLIDTGFKLSLEQGHVEPIREFTEREIPKDLALRGVLELEDEFTGSITWEEGEPEQINARKDLEKNLASKAMIEATYLGGADSSN